jgi:hypothetical protein
VIGVRVGLIAGVRVGVAGGINADPIAPDTNNPMASVTRDSTSGIYWPSNVAEWTTTLSVAGLAGGNPTGLWNCQDASGNLADAIGSQVLTVTGAVLYQQAISGWSRKCFAMNATTAKAVAPAGYVPSSSSTAWLGYLFLTTTPGANRVVFVLSDGATNTGGRFDHTAADKLQPVEGANNAITTNNYTGTAVFPALYVVDWTHSTATLFTHLEARTVTFSALLVDGNKGLGALVGTGDLTARWAGVAAFAGAAAEQFTTSGARSLLSTLGWGPLF